MATDKFQATDYTGAVLTVGMFVDLYYCKIVGFKADENNRLNILVIPGLHKIQCANASNPLIGGDDLKAILVSGYNCIGYPAAPPQDGAGKVAQVNAYATQKTTNDASPSSIILPSNFLVPEIV